jgi:beta-lysine N6-acetyltransferase
MDRIETLGQSLIQHGSASDRLYLMHYHAKEASSLVCKMEAWAKREGYGKIVAKIPECVQSPFISRGYRVEARVPSLFSDGQAGFFVCRYLDPDRSVMNDEDDVASTLKIAKAKKAIPAAPQNSFDESSIPDNLSLRTLIIDDTADLARLYRAVFASYPFPVHQPEYLAKTMQDNIIYFGVYDHDRLVAAASCETDRENKNSEMTDFAVLPGYRGKNLARFLLMQMEKTMTQKRFRTLYTIARATSVGMNVTFARSGYTYGGTLVNNTHIAGKIESMNVWHKILPVNQRSV